MRIDVENDGDERSELIQDSDSGGRLDEEATRIPVTQSEPGVGYAVDREALGRLVRDEWLAWAEEQPEPKASWLQVWEELSEPEREVDRRIGERLYRQGRVGFGRAAGLIRYHLQNADIGPADRAELAAFADILDASTAADQRRKLAAIERVLEFERGQRMIPAASIRAALGQAVADDLD